MYAQSPKNDVKADRQPRHSTAITVVPRVAATNQHGMVAEAAYYAAERRGFAPGFEMDDWLAAEQEVKERLSRKD